MAMVQYVVLLVVVLHALTTHASTEETGELTMRLPGLEGHRRVRRLASESVMNQAEKTAILDKHNELRGQTIPSAANMRFMEWDDTLATHAQQYSDMCIWAHGFPDVNITPFNPVGQNLWLVGPVSESYRPNGAAVTQSWFNEDRFYDYETHACEPGRMCGHYTQVVWATSYAVGCGMTFCPTTAHFTTPNVMIVNCHYGPAGNFAGARPFISGMPCTQCLTNIGQCYNNQCRLCSTHSEECVCSQTCENCGTLDADMCKCACPFGYTGSDCSKDCEDTNENCGNGNLVYSNCNAEHQAVLDQCPATCDLCLPFKDPNFVCATVPPATDPPTTTPASTVAPVHPSTVEASTVSPTTAVDIVITFPATTLTSTNTSATTAGPTTTLSPTCPSLICEHGGTLQLSACKCICKAEYQGKACEQVRSEVRRGIAIVLNADIADWPVIKVGLLDAVAEVLTTYCNGEGFSKCCKGKGTKKNAVRLAFASSGNFLIATGYPAVSHQSTNRQPAFETMLLYLAPDVTSDLCNGGTLSRKRRDAEKLNHVIHRRETLEDVFLDQDVLLEAVEGGLADIRQALTQLNVTVTLESVAAGEEEPLPPADNGLLIAVIVVVSIVALAALILVGYFVSKYISRKQKVTPPMPLN
ncbi:uncharacterized protein LOC117288979 [Asterias rubens]|uniref:uncharacterized protein LOC117288979 n=1 Tax=Asterias rubens TaxID=7604 RepID=UPI001454FEE6|nr:uncharacterized protein LOC117288979 [Asterias rubens]